MKIKKLITSLLLATGLLIGGQGIMQTFSGSDANTFTAYAKTVEVAPDAPLVCPEMANTDQKQTDKVKGTYDKAKKACTYPQNQVGDTCYSPLVGGPENGLLLCRKPADAKSIEGQEQLKKTILALGSFQSFLNVLIWPVLVMIGGLMDNSLLFGSGMEFRLREIWIPIRNIVNILFVVGLVAVALYNVLGIADENGTYSIKEILPKIIIGIIVVNFSFVGIKVFLDGITALTNSIFVLPGNVNEGLGRVINPANKEDREVVKRFCLGLKGKEASDISSDVGQNTESELNMYKKAAKKIGINVAPDATKDAIIKAANAASPSKKTELEEEVKNQKNKQFCNEDNTALSPTGEAFLSRWNSRNAALAMALNMTKIVFYQDVDPSVHNMDKLFVNTVFSMMLYLIYTASFVTLFIVLLARMVVLWVVIAMSPVLVLGFVIPVIKEKISGFGELTDKFVQNAIAPLGIAISMTVGWIMLRALQGVNQFDSQSVIALDPTNGIPVVGLNTLQDLVVAVGTVAIIWLGVFTAASKSIAAPVTDIMKNGLETAGKWLVKTPLRHVKIVPIATTDGGSTPFSVADVVTGLTDKLGERPTNEFYKYLSGGKMTMSDINDRSQIKSADDVLKLVNTRLRIESDDEIIRALGGMNNPGALTDINRDTKLRPLFEILRDPNRKDEHQNAFEKIKQIIIDRKIGKFSSDETAKAEAKPQATQTIPAGAKFNNQDIPATERPRIDGISRSIKTTISGSEDAQTKKTKLEGFVRSLVKGNNAPTAAEVKSYIGAQDYAKLLTALGLTDDAELQTLLNSAKTPAAGTATAAPPAASSGAGTPAGGATPPAAPPAARP